MEAWMCVVPIYLSVIMGWLRGQLNPNNFTYRVSASSEAFGDVWPRIAYLNVLPPVIATTAFLVSTLPVLHFYDNAGQWLLPVLCVAWTCLANGGALYAAGLHVAHYAQRCGAALTSCGSSAGGTEKETREPV